MWIITKNRYTYFKIWHKASGLKAYDTPMPCGKVRLSGAEKGEHNMTDKPAPVCGRHKILKEWRLTAFEYNEEGISIRVPGIYAWVCPESCEASFTPETVDELMETVHELIKIAKRARERGSVFREYSVSVSQAANHVNHSSAA